MAELTLDEADRCSHCNKPLRWPPSCCHKAMQEYRQEMTSLYGGTEDDPDGLECRRVFDDDGEDE